MIARPSPILRTFGPLCVGPGLVADGLQFGHALLEQRIGDVSDAVFDRVVQSLESDFLPPTDSRKRGLHRSEAKNLHGRAID